MIGPRRINEILPDVILGILVAAEPAQATELHESEPALEEGLIEISTREAANERT